MHLPLSDYIYQMYCCIIFLCIVISNYYRSNTCSVLNAIKKRERERGKSVGFFSLRDLFPLYITILYNIYIYIYIYIYITVILLELELHDQT